MSDGKGLAPAGETAAGYAKDRLPLGSGPSAPTVRVEYAVGDYFRVLGLRPEGGRFFEGDEQGTWNLSVISVPV